MKDPRYEYIRTACELCGGAGKLPMKHPRGFYMEYQQHRRKPSCGECLGSGYHDVRRKRLDAGWAPALCSKNHPTVDVS